MSICNRRVERVSNRGKILVTYLACDVHVGSGVCDTDVSLLPVLLIDTHLSMVNMNYVVLMCVVCRVSQLARRKLPKHSLQ